MREDPLLTAWSEGRVPRPPEGKRTRNGLILLAVLMAVLIAAFVLPILVSALDQFHPGSVRGISLGDTREQVMEQLGAPDSDQGNLLEYRGIHFWRVPASGSLVDGYGRRPTVADLIDYLTRRWYLPYIGVEFDSFDSVISVLLDADRPKPGVEKRKNLKEYHLLTTSVLPYVETDLWYAAEYTDGSYYMGIARASYRSDDFGTTRRVEWDDRFGNRCAAEVFIGSQSGNYGEGEGWYITPEFELHILSDAGAQAFLHSGFDRSVIESAVFDYAAETVPESLLNGCYSLREVSLPNGLRTIESSAFADCMSLESIRLPASLESISDWAFSRCSALQAVELPASLREIGPGAFEGCDRLEEIVIPDSVQTIGYSAFSYCTSLRSVRLPAGLRGIDAFLFEACSSLEQIELPASVTSVGDYAFSATSLREITIPQGVTSIGELAFANTPLTAAELPSSVTSVGNRAFLYCSRLQQIRLPQGLRTIGDSAFEGCISLAEIKLPESLTELGMHAFHNCTALRSVILPGSIGQIAEYTFASCSALESVTLGEGITSVGAYAFTGCSSLRELILPETLEAIYSDAFSHCGNSQRFSVTIPASVNYIGAQAFGQSWLSGAVFERPQGWIAWREQEGSVFLSPGVLSDPAAAALQLYDVYSGFVWEREN